MSKTAVGILGGDDELLQSFVRVGLHSEGEDGHQHQVSISGVTASNVSNPGPTTISVPHQLSQPKSEVHLVRQFSDHFSEVSDNKNAPRKYR